MAKKNKFYVVWRGFQPGIYTKWDDCKAQVEGYEGAQYKSFETKSEAEHAFQNAYHNFISQSTKKEKINSKLSHHIDKNSICVDAACSGNPGLMEYRGVDTYSGRELFHKGPYRNGTNNIGEFLALTHGIAYLTKSNQQKIIYTDSMTALAWVRQKKAKTKLEINDQNKELFEIIHRAEQYLQNNAHNIDIRKWETEIWGEIPADFGRK